MLSEFRIFSPWIAFLTMRQQEKKLKKLKILFLSEVVVPTVELNFWPPDRKLIRLVLGLDEMLFQSGNPPVFRWTVHKLCK